MGKPLAFCRGQGLVKVKGQQQQRVFLRGEVQRLLLRHTDKEARHADSRVRTKLSPGLTGRAANRREPTRRLPHDVALIFKLLLSRSDLHVSTPNRHRICCCLHLFFSVFSNCGKWITTSGEMIFPVCATPVSAHPSSSSSFLSSQLSLLMVEAESGLGSACGCGEQENFGVAGGGGGVNV